MSTITQVIPSNIVNRIAGTDAKELTRARGATALTGAGTGNHGRGELHTLDSVLSLIEGKRGRLVQDGRLPIYQGDAA